MLTKGGLNPNKKGTGNTCTEFTQQCHGAEAFPWNGTVLSWHVGEAQWNADPSLRPCRRVWRNKTTKKNKVKKKPWHWDLIHQIAFHSIKATIANKVVLAYLEFTKPFDVFTGTSTKQLGVVIIQDNRPIAFFSWNLSNVQSKYTVTKLKLLAIVETLKEFNGMLWGQRINVYTNHENLTKTV